MKRQFLVLGFCVLSSSVYAGKATASLSKKTEVATVSQLQGDDELKALIEFKLVQAEKPKSKPNKPVTKKHVNLVAANAKTKEKINLLAQIETQYQEWKNTPYRYGGLSRKGVDCSGLVMLFFRDQMNIALPRTTREQVKRGKKIAKGHYKAGDLVFFKTGRNQSHVGIYYKNNMFLHASYSKGVMLSSLDNPYWKKHYWQAMRIL